MKPGATVEVVIDGLRTLRNVYGRTPTSAAEHRRLDICG